MPEEAKNLLTPRKIKRFQKKIYTYYKENKRDFIWRNIKNPYHVMVSEIMLQQTQTSRVKEKYKAFLAAFPTVKKLASAELSEVLALWHGLGYNRRARNLWLAAQKIAEDHKAKVPHTYEELVALPGIGEATAGAVLCYAFNTPFPFIETNVRTVFIHEFFKDKENISDKEIVQYAKETMDRENAREWFYALTDYGVYLKTTFNHSRKSSHYRKQSTYEGSNRQKRSAILKALLAKPLTHKQLSSALNYKQKELDKPIKELIQESFIKLNGKKYHIA